MSDELKQTIRIKRAKVETDDRGRTVWSGPIEETELELVSTVMLKKILDDNNATSRARLDAVSQGKEGVLARDPDTNQFEIIEEYELQGSGELSLVSTQALRRVLQKNDGDAAGTGDSTDDGEEPGAGGFDPYNSA